VDSTGAMANDMKVRVPGWAMMLHWISSG
jgi:hypothetical protein